MGIAAILLTAGGSLFPFFLLSLSVPDHSLTVGERQPARVLQILLIAVIVFLPIILAYTAWVFRVLLGDLLQFAVR